MTSTVEDRTGELNLNRILMEKRAQRSKRTRSSEGAFYTPGGLGTMAALRAGKAAVSVVDQPLGLLHDRRLREEDLKLQKEFHRWIRVLDEHGQPMEGAEIDIKIIHPYPFRYYRLTTDANGMADYNYHPSWSKVTFLGARGYYRFRPNGAQDDVDHVFGSSQTEPKTITLLPIRNPVRFKDIAKVIEVPAGIHNLQLDLRKQDAIPPYGNGEQAHIQIRWGWKPDAFSGAKRMHFIGKEIVALGEEVNGMQWIDHREHDLYKSSFLSMGYTYPETGWKRQVELEGPTWMGATLAFRYRAAPEVLQYGRLLSVSGFHPEDPVTGSQRIRIRWLQGPEGSDSLENLDHKDHRVWECRDRRRQQREEWTAKQKAEAEKSRKKKVHRVGSALNDSRGGSPQKTDFSLDSFAVTDSTEMRFSARSVFGVRTRRRRCRFWLRA
jgi:hypothetical protein